MQPKRGTFLSALIVLFAFAITLATLVLMTSPFVRDSLGSFPSWFNLYITALLVARLIALYGIWTFRRWGVYALLVLECVEVAVGNLVFTSVLTLPIRAAVGVPLLLVLVGIWYLALRPLWADFK
jgi:hypothetical protein